MKMLIQSIKFLVSLAVVLTAALGNWPQSAYACSSFVLSRDGELLFGCNLDFFSSKGMVVVNKRGVVKTALLVPPEKPVTWVSKYGSVTFNQLGREFPFTGMNESGLVIHNMSLADTEYPASDKRPAIMGLQWIQYQLDNFNKVEDVISNQDVLRISSEQTLEKLHFLVCDSKGDVASIEFLGGQLVCHTGQALPVPALTNSTYSECLDFCAAFDTLDVVGQIEHMSCGSPERFVRLAKAIRDFKERPIKPSVEYTFDVLQAVSVPATGNHSTAWSMVFDVQNMRLHFKTFENRNVRSFELSAFDFDCSTPVAILDMNSDLKGDCADQFVEGTLAANENLVLSVITDYRKSGFLESLPDVALRALAHYPEQLKCH